MNCNRKCNECSKAKVSAMPIPEEVMERIVAEVFGSKVKPNSGEPVVCSDEEFITTVVEQCTARSMETVGVELSNQYLVDVVFANANKLDRCEEGFRVKPEFSNGIEVVLFGSDGDASHDVRVIDRGTLDSEGDMEGLVRYLESNLNKYPGIKMSTQTLDAIISVLAKQNQQVIMMSDRVLLPCGGFKIVMIDNNVSFGKVRFTNHI